MINTVSAIRSVHTLKENLSLIFRRGKQVSKGKGNEEFDKVISTSNNLMNKFLIYTVRRSLYNNVQRYPIQSHLKLMVLHPSMMEFFQVWLEMSHLDYCSANFLHVVYLEVKISDVL